MKDGVLGEGRERVVRGMKDGTRRGERMEEGNVT